MTISRQVFRLWLPPLAGFLLVVICLSPILESGLMSDDLIFFQARNGVKEQKNASWIALAREASRNWQNSRRYIPLSCFLGEFAFNNLHSVGAYKLFIFFSNLTAVGCFLFLLWTLGLAQLIPLFLFFYAGEIQMRIRFFDAFTSFNAIYPALAASMFLCIGFFKLYISRGKITWLFISFIFFICSILIVEASLVLIPLLIATSFLGKLPLRKTLASLFLFAIPAGLYIAYAMYLRSLNSWFYPGIQVSPVWQKFWDAFCMQLFSTLPFSNLYNQIDIFHILSLQAHGIAAATLFIILITSLIIVFSGPGVPASGAPGRTTLYVLVFSVSLILFPAALIACTVKYQELLQWGLGYLPVYIQNFGTAFIVSYLAFIALKPGINWLKPVYLLLVFAGFISLTSAFLFNKALIKVKNYTYCNPAQLLYENVEKGILSPCADSGIVYLTADYYWDADPAYRDIFNSFSGKHLSVHRYSEWKSSGHSADKEQCYVLDCPPGDTIYCSLYAMDCVTGDRTLLKRDTTIHSVRLAAVEIPVLYPPH